MGVHRQRLCRSGDGDLHRGVPEHRRRVDNNSDRDRKTAERPIDPHEILQKVNALPITSWQYKDEDAGVRHLGPMAQDFRQAFGLGVDERTIALVDASRVALAAIQGLNAQVPAGTDRGAADRARGLAHDSHRDDGAQGRAG